MRWFLKVVQFLVWIEIGYCLIGTVLPNLGLIVPEEMHLIGIIVFAIVAYFLSGLIKSLIIFLIVFLLVLGIVGAIIYWLYATGKLEQILPILPTLPQIFQILESFLRLKVLAESVNPQTEAAAPLELFSG